MKPKHKAILIARLVALEMGQERIERALGTWPKQLPPSIAETDEHRDHFPSYLAESEDEKARQQRIGGR